MKISGILSLLAVLSTGVNSAPTSSDLNGSQMSLYVPSDTGSTAGSTLNNGVYVIASMISRDASRFIGRSPGEDRSLNPKKVLLLPRDRQAPEWLVRRSQDTFRLEAYGAPVAARNRKLYACLIEKMCEKASWVITPQPQFGPDVYTVETPDRSAGWIIPNDEEDAQIAVRPLIVGPSEPPFFPPNELFKFIQLDLELPNNVKVDDKKVKADDKKVQVDIDIKFAGDLK